MKGLRCGTSGCQIAAILYISEYTDGNQIFMYKKKAVE